ncbi:MAG TPA: hypothetical protein PLA97_24125, partial [Rubrivivax sp.]|nr:hypothetical protein [Rubrivivax sp.]
MDSNDNGFEPSVPLCQLRDALWLDTAGVQGADARLSRWKRSVRRLQAAMGGASLQAQWQGLWAAARCDPGQLLPSRRELLDEVLGHAGALRDRLPIVTTELTLSNPAAFAQRLC